MIKQGLDLKQTQKLSPLQIQTIKLLELPIQMLEQKIRSELEDNPVLDLEDGPADVDDAREDERDESAAEPRQVSLDEIKEDDYIPSYRLRVNNWGKDERPEYNTFSVKQSFTQNLLSQLGYRNLSKEEYAIAAFIIGSLDGDGYLRRDIDSIVDDLAFRAGIETDYAEVERLLSVVQEFDPAGVGARDLRECLMLQLRSAVQTPSVELAQRILEECFTEFANKHFDKIQSRLGVSQEQLRKAMQRIVKLNPSPGGQIDDSYNDQAQQIVPDFVLTDDGDRLGFVMPRLNIPEVRLNRRYRELLEQSRSATDRAQKEAAVFVKQKYDSAKSYVEALKQRENTLHKTMQAILDYQYEFFADGDETHLRPMVLKDIAEKTGFDISTISRVVNSKYIETHFGIFPLKYFFSEGMENIVGEEVSTRELKKALQECIDAENKKKPFTDEQLVEEMSRKGYKLARRTVAKYRSQLGIPLARWRKEL